MDKKELKTNLKKLAQESPERHVAYQDLFNPQFMQKYTNFVNIDFFLKDLKVNDFTQLEKVADLDSKIKKETKFNSWQEMQQTAVSDYLQNLF